MRAATATAADARRVAIVTKEEAALPDVQQFLAAAFHTTFLNSDDQILPLLSQVPLDAIILDIDTNYTNIVMGAAIVVAVVMDQAKSRLMPGAR